MKTAKRILWPAVIAAVILAGCKGPTHVERKRTEARERWEASRTEMSLRLARGCDQRGEVGRARQHVEEAIGRGLKHPALFAMAARLAAENGETARAREYALAALDLAPESAEAHYVAGTLDQGAGRIDVAVEHFAEAARLDPTRPTYVLAEAEMLIADDRPEEALRRLDDARVAMPDQAALHAALGDVLTKLGRHEEAAVSYQVALRLDPSREALAGHLASALYFAGRWEEAETKLAALAASEPEFARTWARTMRAECLLALGRAGEARHVAREMRKTDPESVEARLIQAKAAIVEKDVEAALAPLEDALRLGPDRPETHALLGYVLLARGRPAEAIPHLKRALDDPYLEGREMVEALLERAAAPVYGPETETEST